MKVHWRFWQPKRIDCEIGSGIKDRNGKEIFEGDRVSIDGDIYTVVIRDNIWELVPDNKCSLNLFLTRNGNCCEIIGRVREKK